MFEKLDGMMSPDTRGNTISVCLWFDLLSPGLASDLPRASPSLLMVTGLGLRANPVFISPGFPRPDCPLAPHPSRPGSLPGYHLPYHRSAPRSMCCRRPRRSVPGAAATMNFVAPGLRNGTQCVIHEDPSEANGIRSPRLCRLHTVPLCDQSRTWGKRGCRTFEQHLK